MRVLVVPDIHLKYYIFDLVRLVPKDAYDRIVFLGDLVDEWGQQNNDNLYSKTFDYLDKFLEEFDNVDYCYGNHDISYIHTFLETGFSYRQLPFVQSKWKYLYDKYPGKFKMICKHDDVLFSHAGVSAYWVHLYYEGCKIQTIIKRMNKDPFDIYFAEKYLWNDYSPIWIRPQYDSGLDALYKPEKYYQVVGHTPTEDILRKTGFTSCDVFSTRNSTFSFIGSGDLIVIDTKTCKYKLVRGDILDYDLYGEFLFGEHEKFKEGLIHG